MSTQNHPPADGVAPEEVGEPTGTVGSTNPDPHATIRSQSPPIRRSRSDNVLGGVCGGLGAAAGVDPLWFRLGFIFLALSSGIGVLLYIIAWIVIPEATDEDRIAPKGQTNNGAAVFGIFLLAAGSALLADALIPWFDRVVWPLALIGVGVGMIYFSASRRYGS